MQKKEILRAVKFALISASAGLIQIAVFTLLNELVHFPDWLPSFGKDYGPAYLIALLLSVLWNFTINRRYTFRSCANVPLAMLKVLGFYCVFTPVTVIAGDYCTGVLGWNEYLVTGINMVLNFVTEFRYQRFFVFGKTIDTKTAEKKES